MLATFGFILSEDEIRSVVRTYGNQDDDIMYLNFIQDAAPYEFKELNKALSTKTTYRAENLDFKGESAVEALLMKIKHQIKKDRIRLGEFFLDHDILRKGFLPAQKFRGVLYSQKLQLTNEEFELLESAFRVPEDPTKVNYTAFNEDMERIFTEKDLEKNPLKKPAVWQAPSILDPKDVLNDAEERVLHVTLERIGVQIRHRRLLLKPFF